MANLKKSKTLIIDCDGVLYPTKELNLVTMVEAMKKVCRNQLLMSDDEQLKISEQTTKEQHLGLFNYIKNICKYKNYPFISFCKNMADNIDYSGIKYNPQLLELLKQSLLTHNIAIFTNNSRIHIDRVFQQLFHKNLLTMENLGIKICDISTTEQNGYFLPKQSETGFANFIQNIGANANDCTMLDDTKRNIDAAEKVGINGVLITEDNNLEKYLIANVLKINRNKSRDYE